LLPLLCLGVALILSGCAWPFQRGAVFDEVDLTELPLDRAQLLAYSYRTFQYEGPVQSVVQSFIAAQNVLIRDPNNELAAYFAARSAKWLIEFGGEEIERAKLADLGFKWGEKLMAQNPNNGEYIFLSGALLGFKIQESLNPSLIRLRKVHELFEKSAAMVPSYEEGAPFRALGTLLVKMPPWPTGAGDIDEGIETLEEAVKRYPYHPANHLFLAQGLMEDKRFKDAKGRLERTIELTQNDKYGVPGRYWRNEAKKALKKIRKELE
jgi:tetratricopeptide (TPR) repeat protein